MPPPTTNHSLARRYHPPPSLLNITPIQHAWWITEWVFLCIAKAATRTWPSSPFYLPELNRAVLFATFLHPFLFPPSPRLLQWHKNRLRAKLRWFSVVAVTKNSSAWKYNFPSYISFAAVVFHFFHSHMAGITNKWSTLLTWWAKSLSSPVFYTSHTHTHLHIIYTHVYKRYIYIYIYIYIAIQTYNHAFV